MNRAAVAGLIAVGEGFTTEFTRSGHIGDRAGDVRMRQLDRRHDSARSADDGEVVRMAEAAERSRFA